jgi:hypothetical protein
MVPLVAGHRPLLLEVGTVPLITMTQGRCGCEGVARHDRACRVGRGAGESLASCVVDGGVACGLADRAGRPGGLGRRNLVDVCRRLQYWKRLGMVRSVDRPPFRLSAACGAHCAGLDQAAWIDNRLDALARLRKRHPRGVGAPFCHVVDTPPRWSRAERVISQQAERGRTPCSALRLPRRVRRGGRRPTT